MVWRSCFELQELELSQGGFRLVSKMLVLSRRLREAQGMHRSYLLFGLIVTFFFFPTSHFNFQEQPTMGSSYIVYMSYSYISTHFTLLTFLRPTLAVGLPPIAS